MVMWSAANLIVALTKTSGTLTNWDGDKSTSANMVNIMNTHASQFAKGNFIDGCAGICAQKTCDRDSLIYMDAKKIWNCRTLTLGPPKNVWGNWF